MRASLLPVWLHDCNHPTSKPTPQGGCSGPLDNLNAGPTRNVATSARHPQTEATVDLLPSHAQSGTRSGEFLQQETIEQIRSDNTTAQKAAGRFGRTVSNSCTKPAYRLSPLVSPRPSLAREIEKDPLGIWERNAA